MSDRPVMLITGASRGIGAALAEHYASSGAYRVLGCARTSVARSAEAHYAVDLGLDDSVRRMFREIRTAYGRLDILVNNAGVYAESHLLLTPSSTVEGVFRTNVFGAIACAIEAAKLMKRHRFGRIVNLSSVAVAHASPGTSVYGASKAALEQFGRVAAAELAGDGITVNSLRLSIVTDTGMATKLGEDAVRRTLARTATGRSIAPADVIAAIDSLIADRAGAVTGQVWEIG